MKRLFVVLMAAFSLISLAGCNNVRAGYVGVKVDKYGDSRGVNVEVVGPGRYFTGPNTDIFEFPTFSQNEVWTKTPTEGSPNDESITFQTKEGTTINADFGITYHIDPANVAKVFTKYRRGVEEITDIFLRNMVRDSLNLASSQRSMDDLMADKSKFMTAASDDVKRRALIDGITVDTVYSVGDFRWPQQIIAAMNAKMSATQDAMKVENEIRKTEAEAKKLIVTADAQVKIAEAEAQAVELRGVALAKNPQVLQQMAIEKWNGVLPQVTNGATPLINIDKLK